MTSVTSMSTTRTGLAELRRRWQPTGQGWADMVIVHGIAEHSGRYEETGARFAAHGIDVRSFDLVGFGGSEGRRGHVESWSTYLDQVEDNLAAARTPDRPLVLFGHSMGGLLAVELCLSERPAPDALVASSPALAGGALWQRAAAPLMAALVPRLAIPNVLKGEQLSRDPQVGADYFADPLVLEKTTTRLGAEMFQAMRRVRAAVGELEVPTLVLHGGLDTIVSPMATAPMGSLPGVERRLYPTLRHETLNEPEGPEIAREIVDWLEATVTTSR